MLKISRFRGNECSYYFRLVLSESVYYIRNDYGSHGTHSALYLTFKSSALALRRPDNSGFSGFSSNKQ